MKTQFDKIYVLTLISNKERQEFIKEQFNLIGLDFEFIYGTDFYNIKNDSLNNEIIWPIVYPEDFGISPKSFGCAMTHYQAVLKGYEFGYNNILIMEDDICFIKDKNLIEYYLNNIPEDCDFINFDNRFVEYSDLELKYLNDIKENKSDYFFIDNSVWTIGGMMYGLMNRKSIKLYLDTQRKSFRAADNVKNFWHNPTVKRYIPQKCICTDIYNIKNNFIIKDENLNRSYTNIYYFLFNNLDKDMFFNFKKNITSFTRT